MVKVREKGGRKYYICDYCGSAYSEKSMAEKCEAWCSEHDECNPKICRHAIKI